MSVKIILFKFEAPCANSVTHLLNATGENISWNSYVAVSIMRLYNHMVSRRYLADFLACSWETTVLQVYSSLDVITAGENIICLI